jgi:hypothetical protein
MKNNSTHSSLLSSSAATLSSLSNRLQGCHFYLQKCLLTGSWSTGCVDVVTMRYVRMIARKYILFCAEYKMILTSGHSRRSSSSSTSDSFSGNSNDQNQDEGKSRVKRSRLSKEYDTNTSESTITSRKNNTNMKKEVFQILQHGIDLSKTISHILLQVDKSNFWNWNIEARNA